MKTTNARWIALAGFALTAITFVAWTRTDTIPTSGSYLTQNNNDTTPSEKKNYGKKDYKVRDLDDAMKELDRAMSELTFEKNLDFIKMDKEIKAAMQELKNVDMEKVNREIKAAMKNIDWDKTRAEVDKAMREAEIHLKDMDMKLIEKQMALAKESIEAATINSHINMESLKENIEKGLEGAKAGMAEAKKQLTQLKEFTESLEKDGLINKKKGFKVEIKNGEMYINGTKQPKEVNEKYRKYFIDDNYTINNDGTDVLRI